MECDAPEGMVKIVGSCYSFVLTMAGISSSARNFGNPENANNKFRNQEFNVDLGINTYEFKFRMHDPQNWQLLAS